MVPSHLSRYKYIYIYIFNILAFMLTRARLPSFLTMLVRWQFTTRRASLPINLAVMAEMMPNNHCCVRIPSFPPFLKKRILIWQINRHPRTVASSIHPHLLSICVHMAFTLDRTYPRSPKPN